MKYVINSCHGGFTLSHAAIIEYARKKGRENLNKYSYHLDTYGIEFRCDPDLVAVVEELGEEANGSYSELKVVEVPEDIEVTIEDYDGVEWIAEKHRTWQ